MNRSHLVIALPEFSSHLFLCSFSTAEMMQSPEGQLLLFLVLLVGLLLIQGNYAPMESQKDTMGK